MNELDMDQLDEVMQEPPGGYNHGRASRSSARFGINLSAEEMKTSDHLSDDNAGWDLSSMEGGAQQSRGGITSHRGVLHPDEYVHAEALERLLEENLGVSLDEFDEAYRSRGRPSPEVLATRVKLDRVFLAVVEDGGNVEELARILGIARARIYDAAERARLKGDQ